MSIHVYLLRAPYAVAAGTTIQQNVRQYGKLPAAIQDEYTHWLEAHTSLDAALNLARKTHEIDPLLDHAIAAPAKVCDLLMEVYADEGEPLDPGQQQQRADAVLVRSLFQPDLRKLVNLPYSEEWAAVRQILQRVSSDKAVAAAIGRLALAPVFARATTLHEAYGRALGVSVASPDPGTTSRLSAWNTTFAELLIAAHYLGKKHAGLHEIFLTPYEEQLARQQATKPTARVPVGDKPRKTKPPA